MWFQETRCKDTSFHYCPNNSLTGFFPMSLDILVPKEGTLPLEGHNGISIELEDETSSWSFWIPSCLLEQTTKTEVTRLVGIS
jgi:hypothetical protein